MKLKDISHIFLAISIIAYMGVHTFITISHTKEIECLNNKLDSIIISNINNKDYTYSYTPAFENKTPEEGIDDALQYYKIEHPTIVKAQAILESNLGHSPLYKRTNNLFGLYNSRKKEYYIYDNWIESLIHYKIVIQSQLKNNEDYYEFLKRIKYAEDTQYINKLKNIVRLNGRNMEKYKRTYKVSN